MDLWDAFWSAVAEFIADNGLLAVALIVLLRSAAIPIPVPADLLVVMVGARAREEQCKGPCSGQPGCASNLDDRRRGPFLCLRAVDWPGRLGHSASSFERAARVMGI